jgi:putative Mn2+ efflux pump MntP
MFSTEEHNRRDQVEVAVAQVPAAERGISMLIGGLMVFGLALGGYAIGYVSQAAQWISTGLLGTLGSILTGSGIWTIVRHDPR